MVIRFLAIAIALFILSGCSNESNLTKALTAEFGNKLTDPSSLQLKDLSFHKDGTICGKFNAKNKMGGYVGYKSFVYNSNGIYTESILSKMTFKEDNSTSVDLELAMNKLVIGPEHETKMPEYSILWCRDISTSRKQWIAKNVFYKDLLKSYSAHSVESKKNKCEREQERMRARREYVEKAIRKGEDLAYLEEHSFRIETQTANLICNSARRAESRYQALLTEINNLGNEPSN